LLRFYQLTQDASRDQRFVSHHFLAIAYPSLPILGVLIECDPSIKSIIVSIDSANHDYIIEDLDDERVVVKENMVSMLKHKLEEVRLITSILFTQVTCATGNRLCSINTYTATQRKPSS
jgi:TFIIH basal transcription factor complex TTD-A subunit